MNHAKQPSGSAPRPKVLEIVTHPLTARTLLRGRLRRLREAGFDVGLACSPGEGIEEVERREGVPVHRVPMAREIAPLGDVLSLLRLVRLVRRERPALVNAGTPKAGLLGMLAARLCQVPVRVYTVRGLRFESASGMRRRLLRAAERLAASSAHRVVCVSPSLAERYLALGLAPAHRVRVLADGSSNGVDTERFRPAGDEARRRRRRELGITEDALVVGFVGRFTRDKGIEDLAAAFLANVLGRRPATRLLLVGDFESGDPVAAAVAQGLRTHPKVVLTGFVADTARFYAAMDVLAFPSYREGFPNAPLEAAASGVPVVGYRATGTVDAVVDGETGRLVPVGDRDALAAALLTLLADPPLARRLGAAGRERVLERFRCERIWAAWEAEYRRLLGGADPTRALKGLRSPPDEPALY